MKVGIWLMGGILLKERNMVDGATAKLDAGATPQMKGGIWLMGRNLS